MGIDRKRLPLSSSSQSKSLPQQQCLYFLPLPQGQGELRESFLPGMFCPRPNPWPRAWHSPYSSSTEKEIIFLRSSSFTKTTIRLWASASRYSFASIFCDLSLKVFL